MFPNDYGEFGSTIKRGGFSLDNITQAIMLDNFSQPIFENLVSLIRFKHLLMHMSSLVLWVMEVLV